MAGKILTLEEAARQLGVTVEEINRLVDRKKLFPMRDGTTIKFKSDDIDRAAQELKDESSGSSDLSLDLDMSDITAHVPVIPRGRATAKPPEHNAISDIDADGIVLGDPIEPDESIFSADSPSVRSPSQTIVRGSESDPGSMALDSHSGHPPGTSRSSPTNAAGVSGADVLFAESVLGDNQESDELVLESLVSASSPSLVRKTDRHPPEKEPAVGNGSTLTIDFSDAAAVRGGQRVTSDSLVIGSGIGLSGISDATRVGAGLSGVLDSGLSLDDDAAPDQGVTSDVGLGLASDRSAGDGATVLGGDDFELGGVTDDQDSASVVIATDSESDSSSFFGGVQVESEDASIVTDDFETLTPSSAGLGDFQGVTEETKFSVWQICGLVCCSLTLLAGGFEAYDLVRTIGSPEGPFLANPLLNAMSEAFGWRTP